MKTLTSFVLMMFLAGLLAGCLVRTHPNRGRHSHAKSRRSDCPPAYHWNGYKCVHNGRGKAKGHRRR